MKHAFYLLLAVIPILGGCKSNQERVAKLVPASSSNAALIQVLDSMIARDSDSLVPLIDGGLEAQEFFASIIESFEAGDAFEKDFRDTFGDDAWDAFQEPLPAGQSRPDMKLTFLDFDEIRKDALKWKATNENQGVCDLMPGVPLPFKEIEGGWVVEGGGIFPDQETLVGYTETQKMLTDFILSYMKAIGQEGITAEDIDYQMGKEFMILLFGGDLKVNGNTSHPDRFKLDELD